MGERQSRNRCAAAWLLLLAIAGSVMAAVLVPWWNMLSEYEQAAEGSATRIARYQTLLASKDDLEREMSGMKAQMDRKDFFLEAINQELAAAELQKQVKSAVRSGGGTLVSTQNLPSASDEEQHRITVRVRMKGDMDSITETIHALEGGKPLMFVDNLNVRSRRTVRGRRGSRHTVYSMDVDFDLYAYHWRKGR